MPPPPLRTPYYRIYLSAWFVMPIISFRPRLVRFSVSDKDARASEPVPTAPIVSRRRPPVGYPPITRTRRLYLTGRDDRVVIIFHFQPSARSASVVFSPLPPRPVLPPTPGPWRTRRARVCCVRTRFLHTSVFIVVVVGLGRSPQLFSKIETTERQSTRVSPFEKRSARSRYLFNN